MRRLTLCLLLGGLAALCAMQASAIFIWSWDFEVDPTTEWQLTNLSSTLSPPGLPNKTSFQVQNSGVAASLTTLDYLPYKPNVFFGIPYYRESMVQAPALGLPFAVSVGAGALQTQLIGYRADLSVIGPATIATWPTTAFAANVWDISFANPNISGAWGETPEFVKINYLIDNPTAGWYFNLDSAEYSVVPEPGTLLIGAALTGLSTMTLRRRAKKVTA